MALRKIMVSSENTFMLDCQVMSNHIDLLTLMSLFIDRPNVDNNYISQPYLTISQLVLPKFTQRYRNATCLNTEKNVNWRHQFKVARH